MSTNRLSILKTYKLYIGGQFPRTESGRSYKATNSKGDHLANMCWGSKKDVRDAIVSARAAWKGWSARAAFNRGQILYRMAEMLEGRTDQFVAELSSMDLTEKQAKEEVQASIDRLVYYAGWCDKYQQVFGTINPVASSHFNFSVPESSGVVGIVSSETSPLLTLVSLIAPAIAGGNTVVAIPSYSKPLAAISFAEVINDSDVPGGVINIITGKASELAPALAEHMDVNALVLGTETDEFDKEAVLKGTHNLKRILPYHHHKWNSEEGQSPYFIMDLQETKTTWHPIENIGGGGAKY